MNNAQQSRFGTTWSKDHFNGETAFNNMQRAFADVATKYPDELQESFYIFGGRNVRIRFLGRELADHIRRPFSHLKTAGRIVKTPDLAINFWDDRLTGGDHYAHWSDNGTGWHETTLESSDGRFLGQRLPNTFSCLDRIDKRIFSSITWHDKIFIYERGKPLSRLLLDWYNDEGVQLIHTGLVASNNNGILFVGKSGAGKSTSSLACIIAGFGYLSEDYVGLEFCNDSSFIGHSLYNSVFLRTDQLERFPSLAPYAVRGRLPHEEKSVIILSQIFPERLERSVPIRAVVLPRVANIPQSKLQPASKGEALLAVGPTSLLQIPNRGLGVGGFERLAQLVERVPCFRLEVGADLAAIAHCLEGLVAEVSSA
jgi:hypothetical protein